MNEGRETKHENEFLSEAERFATEMAKQVGDMLVPLRQKAEPAEWKYRTNFKTQADDLADALIREKISARYPDHRIISEEAGAKESKSNYVWVVDSLDGTIPYTNKSSEHYGVAVALVRGTEPLVGVFYAPSLGEGAGSQLYTATKGGGAYCNGKRINCSTIDKLNHAFMAMDYGKEDRARILSFAEKLLADDGVGYLTTYAGGAAAMSQVADGRLHGYFHLKAEPWDMAATAVICAEAGCSVTNFKGDAWKLGDESIVVLPPALKDQFFKKINK